MQNRTWKASDVILVGKYVQCGTIFFFVVVDAVVVLVASWVSGVSGEKGKDGSDKGSLRSKRFQSSYCAKVRAEAKKKKVEGGGGGEKRKRLPANPTILENAPWYFTVRFLCKLTARQNRNITDYPMDNLICKITLFSNRTRCRRLQEL